jgi:hypothetical protein
MLNWLVEKIWAVVTWVPAWFVEEGSPRFMVVRGMFALILITLVVCVIAMWPSNAAIGRYVERMLDLFTRKR